MGIIGRDPSVSKSNWLYVDIFRFFYIDLRYILWIPLNDQYEVFQLQHVFSQSQLVYMQLVAGSSRSLIGCTLVVRFVALLWALLILQLIMVVGSHHELSHPVSNCKIVRSNFENRSRDAKVVRPS